MSRVSLLRSVTIVTSLLSGHFTTVLSVYYVQMSASLCCGLVSLLSSRLFSHFTTVLSLHYRLVGLLCSRFYSDFATVLSVCYYALDSVATSLTTVLSLHYGLVSLQHSWFHSDFATIWSLRYHLVKTLSLRSGRVTTSGRSTTIWSFRSLPSGQNLVNLLRYDLVAS